MIQRHILRDTRMNVFCRGKVLLTGMLMLGVLGSIAAAPVHAADETAAAKQIVVQYFQALQAAKLDAIVALYAQDAVFLPKNAPAVRGIAAITKSYAALFSIARLDTQHEYQQVEVHGNIAIVESQGHGTLTLLKDDKVIPSNNKELFVLRKISGKWRIIYYMFNDRDKPAPASHGGSETMPKK